MGRIMYFVREKTVFLNPAQRGGKFSFHSSWEEKSWDPGEKNLFSDLLGCANISRRESASPAVFIFSGSAGEQSTDYFQDGGINEGLEKGRP